MKKEKLRERIMCIPPKRDITFEELDLFLRNNGFILKRNAQSAHPMYAHNKYKELTAEFAKPHGNTNEVRPTYIKNIQRVIEQLEDKEKEP